MTITRATTGPTRPRLGVDIGRVLIDGAATGADTSFFGHDEAAAMSTPEVPGAAEGLARLVDAFGGEVWLVSKCGPRVAERSLRWLDHHRFHERTGLLDGRVRFCRTRQAKRDHCLDLGLTHFVDDHPQVHAAVRGVVAHQFLLGDRLPPHPSVVRVPSWPALVDAVLDTLVGRSST